MPIYIPSEATCDNCGKTAPCKLDCAFVKTYTRGDSRYETVGAAIRGLGTWFWSYDGIACSQACKQALAKQPRFADYEDEWVACS